LVECVLCGTQVKARIKRLKEHLVGGYGDAIKCPETTTEIAAAMEAALVKGRRRRVLNLDDDDDGVQVVEVVPSENQVQGQHPSSTQIIWYNYATSKFKDSIQKEAICSEIYIFTTRPSNLKNKIKYLLSRKARPYLWHTHATDHSDLKYEKT